jgi:PAS domain S-box-containing protein
MATAHSRQPGILDDPQRLLERVFASLRNAVFVIDGATGGILHCNRAASVIFGHPQEALIGRSFWVLHAEQAAAARAREEVLSETAGGGMVPALKTTMRRADGTLFPCEVTVTPLDDSGRTLGYVAVVRDRSERVRSESALRISERRFGALVETMPDLLSIHDERGRFTYASSASGRLLGLHAAELTGTSAFDLIHPDDRPRALAAFEHVVQQGSTGRTVEMRVRQADGTWVWVETIGSNHVHDAGIEGILLVTRGIAERKQVEEELRRLTCELDRRVLERTSQLKAVTEILQQEVAERTRVNEELSRRNLDLSILYSVARATGRTLGTDHVISTALDAVCTSLGIDAVACFLLRGDCLELRAHRNLDARLAQEVATLDYRVTVSFEAARGRQALAVDLADRFSIPSIRLLHAAGFRSLASAPLAAGGTVLGALIVASRKASAFPAAKLDLLTALGQQLGSSLQNGSLFDSLERELGERTKAEQALRDNESVMRGFYDSAPFMLGIVEAQDDDVLHLLDNPKSAAFHGRPAAESSALGLDSELGVPREVTRAWLHHAREAAERGKAVRFEYSYDDGTGRRWLATHLAPLAAGGARRFCYATRDTTAQREAEEEIKTLNAELENRAAALEAANRELQAFSYSVSHDLRAPLRAIAGFARILLEEDFSALSPDAQRRLDIIVQQTRRMGDLIDDLLALSRLSRQALRLQPVSPAALVDEVRAALEADARDRKIEWIVGELPGCQADAGLLRQVFANLLGNAVKFTRERPAARIEVGHHEGDAGTVYFVRDNGVGFDMKYAGKLFEPFQRLHRLEDFDGTGIGLAIVRRIVERHGGTIWTDAAVNGGAAFFFTLRGAGK